MLLTTLWHNFDTVVACFRQNYDTILTHLWLIFVLIFKVKLYHNWVKTMPKWCHKRVKITSETCHKSRKCHNQVKSTSDVINLMMMYCQRWVRNLSQLYWRHAIKVTLTLVLSQIGKNDTGTTRCPSGGPKSKGNW